MASHKSYNFMQVLFGKSCHYSTPFKDSKDSIYIVDNSLNFSYIQMKFLRSLSYRVYYNIVKFKIL